MILNRLWSFLWGKRLVRIFIIIGIPLIFSIYYISLEQPLTYPFTRVLINETNTSEGYKIEGVVPENQFSKQFLGIIGKTLIQTRHFPCFEDIGSFNIYYPTARKEYNVNWTLTFNKKFNTSIIYKDIWCYKNISRDELKEGFSYHWLGIIGFNPTIEELKINKGKTFAQIIPKTDSYFKKSKFDMFCNIVIIFLGWFAVFWLISRIYKLIKEGG